MQYVYRYKRLGVYLTRPTATIMSANWFARGLANSTQAVSVNPKPPLRSTSLNWDAYAPGADQQRAPILSPRDVVQVAFILEQESGTEQPDSEEAGSVADNKRLLGQLAIQWRGALGDRGSLSTGWLTCRR